MAEMLTPRDVEKVLSLLRRVYASIVIDMSSYLNDINLAFLDASDVDHRDRHLRLDDDPQHGRHRRHVPVDRLPGVEGPLPRQPGRLAGRHRPGRPRTRARARPRAPRRVRRDARGPVEQRGRAVRAGQPGRADQPGPDARRRRARSTRAGSPPPPGGPEAAMPDRRPIGVFDSGVGGLTVLREIVRRSPAESTVYLGDNARAPYGVRSDAEVLAFSHGVPRPACRAATSRRSSSPATPRPRSRSVRSGAATTCRSSASSGRAPRRPRWPPATGGSGSSPRRRRSARTPTSGRSRTRTRRSRSTSTRRRRSCRWSRPASWPARSPRPRSREALAPLLGERDAAGESIFPRPPGAAIDTLLLGCTHYPLLRDDHRGAGRRARRDRRFGDGDGVRAGRAPADQRARRGWSRPGDGHVARMDGPWHRRRIVS